MLHILIAGVRRIIAEGIASELHQDPSFHIQIIVAGGDELPALLQSKKFDVLLLAADLRLSDGTPAVVTARKQNPAIKILLLADSFSTNTVKHASLAQGMVLSDCAVTELIKAIRIISQGGEYFSSEAQKIMAAMFRAGKTGDHIIAHITAREKEILQCMADDMTTKEIARHLHLSTNTVDGYRKSLLSKFNVHTSAALVKEALNLGLID